MNVEMSDTKPENIESEQIEQQAEQEIEQQIEQAEQQAEQQGSKDDQQQVEDEVGAVVTEQDMENGAEQAQHQYDQQYDGNYEQQYEEGGYEGQAAGDGVYEQDPNGYDQAAVDVVAAVASAAAAASHDNDGEHEYAEQQGGEGEQGYVDPHSGEQEYVEDPSAQQGYGEQDVMDEQHQGEHEEHQEEIVDEQTLASHPATSREIQVAEAMVVDTTQNQQISSEVSQAIDRYDNYTSSHPGGLQTLAATSTAITPHAHNTVVTPSHQMSSPMQQLYHSKPLTPKFNRARNWTRDETKILLVELERIVSENNEDRREVLLRSHTTFEQTAQVLREHGFIRDGQGCMIRWRNLLRVYKQQRAMAQEGDTQVLQSYPYSSEIESIYRFPPEGVQTHYAHHDSASPADGSTPAGHTRTWSQTNGSTYETPARKRAREMNMMSENIERMDQKLDQLIDIMNQQNETIRSLEDRLLRSEEILKQNETAVSTLNTTIGDKDNKRDELEKQLMVTVQALSQVIAAKKSD